MNEESEDNFVIGEIETGMDVDSLSWFETVGEGRDERYKIVRRSRVGHITKFRVNGKVVKVIVEREPREIMEENNISFCSVVSSVWKLVDTSEWQLLESEYNEMIIWRNELCEISDGWADAFDGEVEAFRLRAADLIDEFAFVMNEEISSRYFLGKDSSVRDLSRVDGVLTYGWASLVHLSFEDVKQILFKAKKEVL